MRVKSVKNSRLDRFRSNDINQSSLAALALAVSITVDSLVAVDRINPENTSGDPAMLCPVQQLTLCTLYTLRHSMRPLLEILNVDRVLSPLDALIGAIWTALARFRTDFHIIKLTVVPL